MSAKIVVSFDSLALAGLDDTIPVSEPLTDFQACMILQACLLLDDRQLWQPMSDAEWNALQASVAALIESVQT